MRKANASRGIFLCFIMNLFLNLEWAAAAAIFFALHLWLSIPWLFAAIVGAFWIIQAIVLALLVQWGSRSSSVSDAVRPNKNPYSSKPEDLFQDPHQNGPDQHS